MTADERILEDEIDRCALMLSVAKTSIARRAWAKQLEQLVSKRTPDRVAEMEKDARLYRFDT